MSARHAAPVTPGTPLRVEYGIGSGKRRAPAPIVAPATHARLNRLNGVHAPLANPSNSKGRIR